MTYEEFLRAYDGRNAEWVEGEAIEMSPTSWENQDLADVLTAILRSFVEAKDLGVVLSSRFQMKMPARAAGREPDVLFTVGGAPGPAAQELSRRPGRPGGRDREPGQRHPRPGREIPRV